MIDQLIKRAAELYPQSFYMQMQWIKQTKYLIETGKHILLRGKYPNA